MPRADAWRADRQANEDFMDEATRKRLIEAMALTVITHSQGLTAPDRHIGNGDPAPNTEPRWTAHRRTGQCSGSAPAHRSWVIARSATSIGGRGTRRGRSRPAATRSEPYAMSRTTAGHVGVVIVSQSRKVAEGAADMVRQMV